MLPIPEGEMQAFVDKLLAISAIQFGEFKLKSGSTSPIYLDLRRLRSAPVARKAAVEILHSRVRLLPACSDHIADIPHGVSNLVGALAYAYDLSQLTPRKPKEHGTQASVEGIYKRDDTVVIIDDVITSAQSKFEAITILEGAGLVVKDVIVLVDREQGGEEELAKRGYTLHAAITLHQILEYCDQSGVISSKELDRIKAELWQE